MVYCRSGRSLHRLAFSWCAPAPGSLWQGRHGRPIAGAWRAALAGAQHPGFERRARQRMPFPQERAPVCTSWGTMGSRPPLQGQLVFAGPATDGADTSMELFMQDFRWRSHHVIRRPASSNFFPPAVGLFPFRASSSFLAAKALRMLGIARSWLRYSASCSNSKQVLPVGHAALLVPAVQSAREAARRAQKLQDLGLSATGAQQFVAGLPMNGAGRPQISPADRLRRSRQRACFPRRWIQPNDA